MRSITKISLGLVLGIGTLLPVTAQAGYTWTPWYKPDLKIASIGPSSISPYYARVVITNTGLWSSGSCVVRLKIMKASPVYVYYTIPAMSANSGLGVDIYTGHYLQKAGQVTYGYVDVFNGVSESNESNNSYTYIAPPW